MGLPDTKARRQIFKRFVRVAAQELAEHCAEAGAPRVGADVQHLARFADPALLDMAGAALRPLPAVRAKRLTAKLKAVLHPSVGPWLPCFRVFCGPAQPSKHERFGRDAHGRVATGDC